MQHKGWGWTGFKPGFGLLADDFPEPHFHIWKLDGEECLFGSNDIVVDDVFVLTATFTTYLTRPLSEGVLRSEGRVVNQNRSQIIAEAVARDDQGREVARGNGIFVQSRIALDGVEGYDLAL